MPLTTQFLSKQPLRALTETEIRRYEEDGAIVARGIIAPDWIEHLRDALEEVLAAPGQLGTEMQAEGQTGRFFGDLFTWLYHDSFRALVFESALAPLAAQVMRSRTVNFFYDQVLVKEPNTPAATPWHQDLPYWSVAGEQIASIWLPLDTVSADSGSVVYIKGSHRWPETFQAVNFAEDGVDIPKTEGHLETPDFNDDSLFPKLCWELEPGDVLIHHSRTLHSATGNQHPSRRRRAIATRWTGDDAVFDPRPNTLVELPMVKPFIPDPELKPGEPMGGPLFPRVWPRS